MAESQLGSDLASYVGKSVLVKLKNNMEFKGILSGFDDYINLMISDAQEIRTDGKGRKFDRLIFKGGLVSSLIPSD